MGGLSIAGETETLEEAFLMVRDKISYTGLFFHSLSIKERDGKYKIELYLMK